MESFVSMIGLTIPFSAKDAVMQEQRWRCFSSKKFQEQRNGRFQIFFRFDNESKKHPQAALDSARDDETASTTSVTEDDDDVSCSFSVYSDCRSEMKATVTFATALITDIHYRPRTLPRDIPLLYYSDEDYRSFRRAFYGGTKSVRFLPDLVTHVWEYETGLDDENGRSVFHYSEDEIQGFLDDFIKSLNVDQAVSTHT